MENYSTSSAIREMQIKTSQTALHTHQNGQNTEDKIKTLVKMWWEYKMVQPFLENSLVIPQKVKHMTEQLHC